MQGLNCVPTFQTSGTANNTLVTSTVELAFSALTSVESNNHPYVELFTKNLSFVVFGGSEAADAAEWMLCVITNF
jgi:hypothetical protein